jgi:hypothetical protein
LIKIGGQRLLARTEGAAVAPAIQRQGSPTEAHLGSAPGKAAVDK